jgi:hypothetical protein
MKRWEWIGTVWNNPRKNQLRRALEKLGFLRRARVCAKRIFAHSPEGVPMKRAVLYLRVSTTDQTTANQERELRQVAE